MNAMYMIYFYFFAQMLSLLQQAIPLILQFGLNSWLIAVLQYEINKN